MRCFFWLGLLLSGMMWAEFVIDEPAGRSGSSSTASSSFFDFDGKGTRLDMLGTVNTFDTLGRGVFTGRIMLYENGGFGFRFQVGIFDVLDIGVSESVENVIGVGNPQFFIPGAYIKLQILKDVFRFHWAVGFDTFGYGMRSLVISVDGSRDVLYGFYSVLGWKFRGLGSDDYLLFGVRVPLLPADMRKGEAVSLMGGISIHVGKYFFVCGTVEHVYFVSQYWPRILPSVVVGFSPSESFELQILFHYLSEMNSFSRSLLLGYKARF